MKLTGSRTLAAILFAVVSVAPCFAHHMAVVVPKQNTVTALSSAQLGKIFRAETKKWPDGTSIQLVLHRASTGEAITLQRLNKKSAQQWQNWIAEHKDSIKLVDSDEDVLNYVENTPGAVGLVAVHSLNDRVNIIRVDGKVPMEEGYLPH
jgi:phosphate transport system substrate-binding protein